MGEMADYLINGDDCQICGMPFEDGGDGYPRTCEGCKQDQPTKRRVKKALRRAEGGR